MLKSNTYLPSEEEDSLINAGIAADPDTYELSQAEFLELQPYQVKNTDSIVKERITLDLPTDMLAAFRATGSDWRLRMETILQQWLRDHIV